MREELEGQVVVAKFATTTRRSTIEGITQTQQTEYYNLDVIISVGYRVKSKGGIAFRKWANSVLTEYIIKGYAINDQRLQQLGEVIRIMKRTQNELDAKQVLSVIENYNNIILSGSFTSSTLIRLLHTLMARSCSASAVNWCKERRCALVPDFTSIGSK